MDLESLEENHEISIEMKGRDKRSCTVIKNIQDLDVSLQEVGQKLKMVRAESLDLQLKNCEELKNQLATETPESETLAKNTQRFLKLFAAEEKNGESSDKSDKTYKKHIRCPKLQGENKEPQISMSITDEEKQRIDYFTSEASDCSNEKNFDQSDSIADLPFELNPYSIDESSKKLLKELEDKLEMLDRRK